jgi:hypothetical protein
LRSVISIASEADGVREPMFGLAAAPEAATAVPSESLPPM